MSEHDTRGKVAISPFLSEAADLPSEAVSLRSTRNRKLVARIAIYSESPPEKLLLQASDTDGYQFDQQLHLISSLVLRSLILGHDVMPDYWQMQSMPYRFLCNDVQRESAKPSPDMAFGLFCYVPLHNNPHAPLAHHHR